MKSTVMIALWPVILIKSRERTDYFLSEMASLMNFRPRINLVRRKERS